MQRWSPLQNLRTNWHSWKILLSYGLMSAWYSTTYPQFKYLGVKSMGTEKRARREEPAEVRILVQGQFNHYWLNGVCVKGCVRTLCSLGQCLINLNARIPGLSRT